MTFVDIFQVKGYSLSKLDDDVSEAMDPEMRKLYERVWDEADYVVPPAENGAFFVTTNVIITPNQTYGTCPEVSSLKEVAHCYILFFIRTLKFPWEVVQWMILNLETLLIVTLSDGLVRVSILCWVTRN